MRKKAELYFKIAMLVLFTAMAIETYYLKKSMRQYKEQITNKK
jgi:hypothetical protein